MSFLLHSISDEKIIKIIAKSLIREGYTVRMKAEGISMYPFLKAGDFVYVKRVEKKEITPGNVLVFESYNQWIAHRLVQIEYFSDNKIELICKGDSLLKRDSEISFEQVIGIIEYYDRNGSVKVINSGKSLYAKLLKACAPTYTSMLFKLRLIKSTEK